MKGKNKESFNWLLNEINNLSTKGKFEVRENIVEGLLGTGLATVDALELNLEFLFIQESGKEINNLRKKYHVTGDKEKELDTYYDSFYSEIIQYITCGKTVISGNIEFYSCRDLIKNNLNKSEVEI